MSNSKKRSRDTDECHVLTPEKKRAKKGDKDDVEKLKHIIQMQSVVIRKHHAAFKSQKEKIDFLLSREDLIKKTLHGLYAHILKHDRRLNELELKDNPIFPLDLFDENETTPKDDVKIDDINFDEVFPSSN